MAGNELQVLQNIEKFLSRVQLTGSEVPAYVEIMQYLQKRAHEIMSPPAEDTGG